MQKVICYQFIVEANTLTASLTSDIKLSVLCTYLDRQLVLADKRMI